MTRSSLSFLFFLLLAAGAAPLAAQVSDTTRPAADTLAAPVPVPPDTAAVEAPLPAVADTTPPAVADTTPPAAAEPAAEAAPPAPTHDWEFALSAGQSAVGAGGNVLVTESDPDNGYAVVATGLPAVDSLDQEGRDLAAYTVWVVPSKERVREAVLAGTLARNPDGTGRFEGRTALDTFGIIVMASPEGATGLSGVPVLTGIPVTQSAAPAEEAPAPVEEAPAATADETPDAAADETPDDEAPETPDDAAPETPDEEPAPPAPGG